MKRFAAKLGFIHRTLWHRDRTYRWAVLLGPPPLLGCAVAALAWQVMMPLTRSLPAAGGDAPWAHWNRPVAEDNQPVAEAPSAALPSSDARGGFVGFQPGWVGTIHPLSVDATLDVNVVASAQGQLTLDQPTIPLERVADAAPPSGLFVALERSFFVVRTSGLYAFSARLTRAGTKSANCMVRLASGHHQILRNVVLNSAGTAVLNFASKEFQLEPGLFLLQAAVGCWRGEETIGAGEMVLLVRHPGEASPRPAAAGELVRPVQRSGIGAR